MNTKQFMWNLHDRNHFHDLLSRLRRDEGFIWKNLIEVKSRIKVMI